MGCMSRCAKYFLCFFNFIFFIAGGAALALGIWLIADKDSLLNLIDKADNMEFVHKTQSEVIHLIAYIFIGTGALTFIVSFLGYCGAMFESRCLLCVYGTLILVIVILQSVAAGLAFGLDNTQVELKKVLQSTMDNYKPDRESAETVTVIWNGIMTKFHCCGVDNYEDFKKYSNFTQRIPEACCKRDDNDIIVPGCTQSPNESNSYYNVGCYEQIKTLLEENMTIVIAVAVGMVFIEILVIILALYLACCYWRPQHGRNDIKVNY